jgi:hypothetical protein
MSARIVATGAGSELSTATVGERSDAEHVAADVVLVDAAAVAVVDDASSLPSSSPHPANSTDTNNTAAHAVRLMGTGLAQNRIANRLCRI